MSEHVSTPGFREIHASDADLRTSRDGAIGVVLEVYSSTNESFLPGPRCSVLLVEYLQVVRDVMIPTIGGGAHNVETPLPTPTSEDLLLEVNAAIAGDGAIPSPSAYNDKWGSWVTVNRIGGGRFVQMIIGTYLYHPATAVKRIPVVSAKTSARDELAKSAKSSLKATPDDLPDAITDSESIPVRNPPFSFTKSRRLKDAWVSSYRSGWTAGAERGYLGFGSVERDSGASMYNGLFADAEADGWKAGWDDGIKVGERERTKNPPSDTPTAPVSAEPVDQPEESGDVDNEGAVAAVTTGNDRFLEWHGNRVILHEAGGVTIDSRSAQNSAPIRVQGGSGGVVLTAGGAVVEVGADGKRVHVTADMVTLGGNEDHVILGYRFLLEYLDHTHQVLGAQTLKPDQQFLPGDMLSEKARVG